MRIELLRSGGFANIELRRSLDTDELTPAEARELAELVDQIDIEELSKRSPIRARGADRFQYDIVIITAGERHEVSVGEGEMSPPLHRLVYRLLQNESR